MRTLSGKKGYQDYLNTVETYLARIDTQYTKSQFWDTLDQHVKDNLVDISKNISGDRNMSWTDTNTRYPFTHTLPGLMAEVIAAVNWHHLTSCSIQFATDRQSQVNDTIDFWITPTINSSIIDTTEQIIPQSYSVQVKAVIFKDEILQNTDKLFGIKSDYISLVDIDDYHHTIITPDDLYYMMRHANTISLDVLQTHPAKYFDNVYLYGSKEDKLVRTLINK